MKESKDNLRPKPNFLIVGAAKAGTTSAVNYLNQHPDIYFPEKKEIRFFIRDIIIKTNPKDPLLSGILNQSTLEETEYFDLFQVESKLAGEASVHYLYHYEEAIPQIKKYVGDIPIIIFLRNPTERAISNIKFLSHHHQSTIRKELAREEERKNDGFNSFWYYKSLGLYSKQVEAFLKNFSKVEVILFEDFIRHPQQELNKLYQHLGVDIYQLEEFPVHNRAKKQKQIFRTLKKSGFIDLGKRIVGEKGTAFLQKKIAFKLTEKVKLEASDETLAYLNRFYKEDIKRLGHLLKKDLSIWK